MKSLMSLWKRMADESAMWCRTSTTRDFETITRRVKHEGLSFLTITLTDFGKDFERSLELSRVDPSLFLGFKKRGGLPLFLGGFLDLVFDRSTGVLLDEPSIEAIRSIRQLTLMFGKIALPCTSEREVAAIDAFIQCEHEIKIVDESFSDEFLRKFHDMSSYLFASVFSAVDYDVYHGELLPKHGPGATADKYHGNGKYRFSTWPIRLNQHFPLEDYVIPNSRYYEILEGVDLIEPGSETPIKVVTVPKTQKTPRIIGIEPVAMQYAQQAVLRSLLEHISDDRLLRELLGFDDQVPNQVLAQIGSSHKILATLDLSEASDRVSYRLVREMLKNHPHLLGAVDSCRSRSADVPGHGIIPLSKFAPMGSALCFPFEAMVFLALILIGIEESLRTPVFRPELVRAMVGKVRVYGDDIVVPVNAVHSVIHSLESFGFKVNGRKSFWNGKFRESCGKEYYDGHDVSLVRVRNFIPESRKDVTGVVSLVSFRNQLYQHGYWATCAWLDEKIRRILKYFPVVLPSSPVLGRHSCLGYETTRLCDKLHSPLVRGYVVSARIPKNPLGDVGALLKVLLQMEHGAPSGNLSLNRMPTVDVNHLERSGRPQAVDIKLRWCSPF